MHRVPIYEFECEECGERFEDLVAAGTAAPACPACKATGARRLLSTVSPPGRLPRGPGMRDSQSRRVEREAARGERLAETKKQRAAGNPPPPRTPKQGGKG